MAVYDGSSAIENLKAKFCSTVANDVMLKTGVGVIRMWADEGSRLSRFRMLFTSFVERKYIVQIHHIMLTRYCALTAHLLTEKALFYTIIL